MIRPYTCLFASAAILMTLGQTGIAVAQSSYQTGSGAVNSSASFSRGPSLPDLSPDEIAADVVTEYNRRTGAPEAVGPTFDPFEDDEDLAGRVNFRTTDSVRDLDGTTFQDGVLLDLELYYTDYGDRAVGRTRDAVFMNGAPVPVILSDSRELECSSRVTETVYQSDRYYSPGYGGLYRSRPRYIGHSLFDIHVWGGGHRGWRRGAYPGHYGPPYVSRPRPYRPVRPHRPVRPRPVRPPRVDRRPDRRPADITPPQELTRTVPGLDLPRSRVDYFINGQPADTYGKYDGLDREPAPDRRPRRSRGGNSNNDGEALPDTLVPSRRDLERRDRRERVTTPDRRVAPPQPRRTEPRRTEPRTEPRRPESRRPETRRPEPRRSETRRTEPRRTQPAPRPVPRPEPRSQPKVRPNAPIVSRPAPEPRPDRGTDTPIRYDMFPDDRPHDGVVIRSQRDCAREDRVTLLIPYERLEAARFDGLVIIIRDVSYDPRIDQTTVYDERPLYIPPNYIEGFKQGADIP